MPTPKNPPLLADRKSRLPPSISRRPPDGIATRILIVDHDRQLGVTLSFMLATRRFDEVRAVRSARRALAVAEQFLPEIVFLDLDLPDGGGAPLARLIAKDARGRRPRFIALTKLVDEPTYEMARAAGFERLLLKPLVHEHLDKVMGLPQTAA